MGAAHTAERKALAKAIDRVALHGADDGHIVITLKSKSHYCYLECNNNTIRLISLAQTAGDLNRVETVIDRMHGELNPYWIGCHSATDTLGREWEHWLYAVIDDFGNLVEVPQ